MELTKEIIRDGFTKYYWNGVPFYAVAHHITQPDARDLLHDHPFSFTSFIIKGSYLEQVFNLTNFSSSFHYRKQGSSHRVEANTVHQIYELPEGECWTLILPEQKVQEPSLYKFEGDQILKRFWYEQEFKAI